MKSKLVALKKQAIKLNTLYMGLLLNMTEIAVKTNNKLKNVVIIFVKSI